MIDAVMPLEFRVIAPALAATGWVVSTPEYAWTAPVMPVAEGVENVYSTGSAVEATRTKIACESAVEELVHVVRTTSLHPVGAETGDPASRRDVIAARRTSPAAAPVGAGTVSVWDEAVAAALVAEVKVGVAAGASPSSPPPNATAAAATATRRPVTFGT
ncbi:MAG TPA: hypothetical protein VIG93_07635 [Gaiellaceae bacterium]